MSTKDSKTPARFVAGFDVVVQRTVGTVTFDENGGNPYQAAFGVIAAVGDEGVYSFPGADQDQMVTVTVEYRNDKRATDLMHHEE